MCAIPGTVSKKFSFSPETLSQSSEPYDSGVRGLSRRPMRPYVASLAERLHLGYLRGMNKLAKIQ